MHGLKLTLDIIGLDYVLGNNGGGLETTGDNGKQNINPQSTTLLMVRRNDKINQSCRILLMGMAEAHTRLYQWRSTRNINQVCEILLMGMA